MVANKMSIAELNEHDEVVFATLFEGTVIDRVFYGVKCSLSDFTSEGEFIAVDTTDVDLDCSSQVPVFWFYSKSPENDPRISKFKLSEYEDRRAAIMSAVSEMRLLEKNA